MDPFASRPVPYFLLSFFFFSFLSLLRGIVEGQRSGSNNSRCNFRLEKSWRIYACTYITVVEGIGTSCYWMCNLKLRFRNGMSYSEKQISLYCRTGQFFEFRKDLEYCEIMCTALNTGSGTNKFMAGIYTFPLRSSDSE